MSIDCQPVADNIINNVALECPEFIPKEEFISEQLSSHNKMTESTPEIPQQCGNNYGVED